MDSKDLYSKIETLIIRWNNDGTQTAGTLTREIMELVETYHLQSDPLDTDYMYKWITKHSGRK
jgi:hypothetical protein